MARLCLKVVPDQDPDAAGKWLHQLDVPSAFVKAGVSNYVPEPGHHVVKTHWPTSFRDGGPMHASGYYPCTEDHL